jgi:hypothetical protein
MRLRILVCAAVLTVSITGMVPGASYMTGRIGGYFFRYDTAYLSTGGSFLYETDRDYEIEFGGEFGIRTTRDDDRKITPEFFIPIHAGLNFLFDRGPVVLYIGTGLVPAFLVETGSGSDSTFFLGPYVKAGLRVPMHPVMSGLLEVQQDLLFGGEHWVNTATRIAAGLRFSLPGTDHAVSR